MSPGRSLRFMDSMMNVAGSMETPMFGRFSLSSSTTSLSLLWFKINSSVCMVGFLPVSRLLITFEHLRDSRRFLTKVLCATSFGLTRMSVQVGV